MQLSHYSDAELIHAYTHGNDSALETLINRYKDKVYTSVYMLVKDKYLAEDIFQDAFLKMIKTIKEGGMPSKASFYPGPYGWHTIFAWTTSVKRANRYP
jgi:DNA-directed RNA polymerase specialized sigma24 family protein